MMPQIGFSEMLLLAMLALVVLGPRDLPLMMRKLGRWTGKARALAWEFRQSFDEIGRQAELQELRKEVESLKKQSGLDELKTDLEQTSGEVAQEARAAAAPVVKPETQAADAPNSDAPDTEDPTDGEMTPLASDTPQPHKAETNS
ncbi:MAG: Sec-independent protein translocase protein TatB [Pseudomonadota bacterium]